MSTVASHPDRQLTPRVFRRFALPTVPDLANAWLGCGNAHYVLRHYGEALAAYDKAIALKSDLAKAWLCRGNVFFDLAPLRRGVAYHKALGLKPDLMGVERHQANNELRNRKARFLIYHCFLAPILIAPPIRLSPNRTSPRIKPENPLPKLAFISASTSPRIKPTSL